MHPGDNVPMSKLSLITDVVNMGGQNKLKQNKTTKLKFEYIQKVKQLATTT